ncbi:MAG: phosphoglycerate mutase family protein [Candidatus Gastranaerophilales bacterium]|nr:phosphoglycerate mutase family protein [Candidatus Gastranaerophilales bacterium]
MLFGRKCKITFIRHGATINTEENRFYDDESYPAINANGKREMKKISQWVKNKGLKIDKIYASSALRTVQSADILSSICGHNFEILNNLNNRKSGIWNGLSFEEIEQKYPKLLDEYHENPEHFCPEGAESVLEFNKRIAASIDDIIKKNLYKRLIIITHGEVIQAAIANILNIPTGNQFKIYIPTGSATQISYFEDFASLVYSAYIPI